MLPLYLAAAGAIQEATAGKEQQKRDAELKATAYRMLPYLKNSNPESFQVHQADPLKGAVGGLGAGADIEGMLGAGSFLNSAADKNAYDIGALDSGKVNGENLDLSHLHLPGEQASNPYRIRKLSQTNGYNF